MPQTHLVTTQGDLVTKQYVSCPRNEHVREWSALHALPPGLGPKPVSLDLSGLVLVMSWVPGQPLAGALTPGQLDGLEVALRALWAQPADALEPIGVPELLARVRTAIASYRGEGVVGEAHDAAAAWLDGGEVERLLLPGVPVIGHGDPNLSNYLWDGARVRIVDFEDAGVSDLAVELANLVEHIAGRGTDWSGFADRFTVDQRRLLSARRLWACFWLTLLRPGEPAESRNSPGTGLLQSQRVLRLLAR
ncbi:phosphotransferase family protein [Kribbella sp. CA-293567]|uniref:phosphotransferase family protein n=1 Tax=Kribbella sp. CA-293567 TaxID=3002436 RepID=UPI0022DD5894|nr:aminoglycoside phosphotransferase family protein [Kribbella sp. CA-293567]WBQ05243.1 aminoglycoside phosphotransferase family protein [Kribbella sp. CA-293567]